MAHTVYALIVGGEVVNLTVGDYYEVAESAAKIYGQQVIVVDVTRIPVWVGDAYDDGTFWRHGSAIEPIPSDAEAISKLQDDAADLRELVERLIAKEG